MWEEAGVPGENPRVQAGDHHTLSHTTTVDQGDRTRVAAVTSECIVHYATWTPYVQVRALIVKRKNIFIGKYKILSLNCCWNVLVDSDFKKVTG